MLQLLKSSTGVGLKLRIVSFALLIVPALNSLLMSKGVSIAPESVEEFINASFVVAFGVAHIWGWIRAIWKKSN